MTPKQKERHINQLKTILLENNFTLDRYNRYVNGNIMVDTRHKVNLQIYRNKFKISSKPFVNWKILNFQSAIIRLIHV